eukprot:2340959-Alexandrium_andersonii.AAC.1
MVCVVGYCDQLDVSHPDRSYEWLIDQVKKRRGRERVQQGAQPRRAAGAYPRQRQCRPVGQGEGQGRQGGQGREQGKGTGGNNNDGNYNGQDGKQGTKGKQGDKGGKDGKGSSPRCLGWCDY